jgi:hypothetical protein
VLDHDLLGDLFDSVVIGFMAVLGINKEKRVFYDACSYTSNLSALIKIAQLLVVQQAVISAMEGTVPHPGTALDEMRERFMTYNTRSPFAWITRLRAFGKKVRNNTTSLGQIYWSDDQGTLSYQGLKMSMDGFRDFVQHEVRLAGEALQDLLLIRDCHDSWEKVVPALRLSELQDYPAEGQDGFNFLQHAGNQAALAIGHQWLLNHILSTTSLRSMFLDVQQLSRGRYTGSLRQPFTILRRWTGSWSICC